MIVELRQYTLHPGTREVLIELFDRELVESQEAVGIHRDAANATMIDSDNVLLLRPARPGSGFSLENGNRPPPGAREASAGLVVATICYLDATADTGFLDYFESTLGPALRDAGASILGSFVTETSPNTFPTLPVREGENVFVWFSAFPDQTTYDHHVAALARADLVEALARRLGRRPEVLKLGPTARSQLHG